MIGEVLNTKFEGPKRGRKSRPREARMASVAPPGTISNPGGRRVWEDLSVLRRVVYWTGNGALATWNGLIGLIMAAGASAETARLVILLLVPAVGSVIVWTMYHDPRVPVFGVVFGLILMVIARILIAVQRQPNKVWAQPAAVFIWFCLVFFMAASSVLGSALVLGLPARAVDTINRWWPPTMTLVVAPAPTGLPAFQVMRSERTLDLGELTTPGSAAGRSVWRNTYYVKRMREDSGDFVLPYATSGSRADVRSTTHPSTARPSTERPREGGPVMGVRGDLHVDLSSLPIDVETAVGQEAAYYGAFTGVTRDWAAVRNVHQEGAIEYTILFPENRPCRGYRLSAYPNTDKKGYERVDNPDIEMSADGRRLTWRIKAPQLNYCYRVDWDW